MKKATIYVPYAQKAPCRGLFVKWWCLFEKVRTHFEQGEK